MQPLDVALMKPFKSYYSRAIEDWLDAHKGRIVTHAQVDGLFSTAYKQAATVTIATSGFAATGIYSYKPAVFQTAKDKKKSSAQQTCSSPGISTPAPIASTSSASNLSTVTPVRPDAWIVNLQG